MGIVLYHFRAQSHYLIPIWLLSRNHKPWLLLWNKLSLRHTSVITKNVFGSKNQHNYLSKDNDDPYLIHIYCKLSSGGNVLVWIHYTLSNSDVSCFHYLQDENPKKLGLIQDQLSWFKRNTIKAWKNLYYNI